jgi:serine/threonine protein kinase
LIDERGHLKLADLGLATKIDDGEAMDAAAEAEKSEPVDAPPGASEGPDESRAHRPRRLAYTVCGTCDYMAPEVLLRKGYDKTADWWAVGAIVFECLFGYAPFWAETAEQTARKIVHFRHFLRLPSPSSALSAECLDFLAKLLNKSERRLGRLGTEEVKAHPWFASIDWSTLGSGEGPYLSEAVRQAAVALKKLETMPREDVLFLTAVKQLTASFEEAKEISADAEAAALRAAASSTAANKIIGYTYSRDGTVVAPRTRGPSKASAMLKQSRKAGGVPPSGAGH